MQGELRRMATPTYHNSKGRSRGGSASERSGLISKHAGGRCTSRAGGITWQKPGVSPDLTRIQRRPSPLLHQPRFATSAPQSMTSCEPATLLLGCACRSHLHGSWSKGWTLVNLFYRRSPSAQPRTPSGSSTQASLWPSAGARFLRVLVLLPYKLIHIHGLHQHIRAPVLDVVNFQQL